MSADDDIAVERAARHWAQRHGVAAGEEPTPRPSRPGVPGPRAP